MTTDTQDTTEVTLPDKLRWTSDMWDGWAKGHTFSLLTNDVRLNDMHVPAGYYFSNYGIISSTYVLQHPQAWAAVE